MREFLIPFLVVVSSIGTLPASGSENSGHKYYGSIDYHRCADFIKLSSSAPFQGLIRDIILNPDGSLDISNRVAYRPTPDKKTKTIIIAKRKRKADDLNYHVTIKRNESHITEIMTRESLSLKENVAPNAPTYIKWTKTRFIVEDGECVPVEQKRRKVSWDTETIVFNLYLCRDLNNYFTNNYLYNKSNKDCLACNPRLSQKMSKILRKYAPDSIQDQMRHNSGIEGIIAQYNPTIAGNRIIQSCRNHGLAIFM